VRDWWTKLSPAAKRNPKNVDQLVEVTEKILETEMSGWVQRMENALAQLQAEEERGEAQSSAKEASEKHEGTSAEKASSKEKPAPASSDAQN
jgi:hypothetical protein